MNSPFLNWNLGSVTTVFARLATALTDPRPLFAQMRFDRANTLEFPTGNGVEVQFLSNKELQFIRNRSRAAGWSQYGLPLVRVKRAEDEGEVRLDFMFPSTVVEVPGTLPLMVEKAVLDKVAGAADKTGLDSLLKNLVLETGFARHLVRQAPGFIEDEAAMNVVKLLLPSGYWLICRLLQNVRGVYYLHASMVEEVPAEKTTRTAPRIHLLPLSSSGGFKIIRSPDEAEANELGRLNIAASPIVIAWSQYHRLVTAEKKRSFERRVACPLVFQSPEPDESFFRVSLRNWPTARDEWLDDDMQRGRIRKQNISVRLKKSVADPEAEATHGTIQKLSYDGDAWIDTGGKFPPENGVILPNEELDHAGDRRRKAVERLHAAEVALPVLLDILNDPGLAARARVRGHGAADHRGLNERQQQVMERAVHNESVMAVQGPPGTGKTKVIVEIVRHIFLTRRQNETLRVLISSTQNKAVWNAVGKLQSEGVLIHLNLSRQAEERATAGGLTQRLSHPVEDVKNQLETRIREDLDLMRIQECLRVEEALDAALQEFPEEPDAILKKLDDLCAAWSASPLVEMLSAWGEAASLRDQLAKVKHSASATPDKPSSMATLAVRCEELLVKPGDAADAQALAEFIQENGTGLVEVIGAGLVEEIKGELKLHVRAIRDGQMAAEPPHWVRMREIVSRAGATKTPAVDEERSAILRQIQSWRGRCIEQLGELRQTLGNTRGGAIVEWQRALVRDPQIWREICERYSQVVGATAQMAGPRGRDETIEPYDYVIVDEAGRSDLFDLLIPMTLGRRILLVGDQQQLPPFIETALMNRGGEAEADRMREFQSRLASQTLFRELYDRLPEENRAMLNIQYRMHPAIGDAISEAFYAGELLSGPEDHASSSYQDWLTSKRPLWGLFQNRPLVWVDSGVMNAPRSTDHNEIEIRIVMDLVMQALAARPESPPGQPNQPFAGIIAFYSEQVRVIQEAMAALPETRGLVEVGSVDSFQGKEFPLTILSCCRHHPNDGNVGFLNLPNRVNVALSRAQQQLIIVGSLATMLHPDDGCGSQPLKDFCRAAGDNLLRADSP